VFDYFRENLLKPLSNPCGYDNNHEHIRTVEQIVSRGKGGMIISPQIGLHEDVVALDYDSEYANLIVNHNLSYETVTSEGTGSSHISSHHFLIACLNQSGSMFMFFFTK
jgi:DNA polymerase elongation subunit (family B)